MMSPKRTLDDATGEHAIGTPVPLAKRQRSSFTPRTAGAVYKPLYSTPSQLLASSRGPPSSVTSTASRRSAFEALPSAEFTSWVDDVKRRASQALAENELADEEFARSRSIAQMLEQRELARSEKLFAEAERHLELERERRKRIQEDLDKQVQEQEDAQLEAQQQIRAFRLEQQRLQEAADKAEREKQRLLLEVEQAEQERLRLSTIAQQEQQRLAEEKRRLDEERKRLEAERVKLQARRHETLAVLDTVSKAKQGGAESTQVDHDTQNAPFSQQDSSFTHPIAHHGHPHDHVGSTRETNVEPAGHPDASTALDAKSIMHGTDAAFNVRRDIDTGEIVALEGRNEEMSPVSSGEEDVLAEEAAYLEDVASRPPATDSLPPAIDSGSAERSAGSPSTGGVDSIGLDQERDDSSAEMFVEDFDDEGGVSSGPTRDPAHNVFLQPGNNDLFSERMQLDAGEDGGEIDEAFDEREHSGSEEETDPALSVQQFHVFEDEPSKSESSESFDNGHADEDEDHGEADEQASLALWRLQRAQEDSARRSMSAREASDEEGQSGSLSEAGSEGKDDDDDDDDDEEDNSDSDGQSASESDTLAAEIRRRYAAHRAELARIAQTQDHYGSGDESSYDEDDDDDEQAEYSDEDDDSQPRATPLRGLPETTEDTPIEIDSESEGSGDDENEEDDLEEEDEDEESDEEEQQDDAEEEAKGLQSEDSRREDNNDADADSSSHDEEAIENVDYLDEARDMVPALTPAKHTSTPPPSQRPRGRSTGSQTSATNSPARRQTRSVSREERASSTHVLRDGKAWVDSALPTVDERS
ncbi:hypothetical protein PYCC9005_004464 [Savitreella phatthalungensis]